jgi:hypothetical protein
LIHSMRLSLMKGAYADLSSTAWQEIGVKPFFGLSGIVALDVPLPIRHVRPRDLKMIFCVRDTTVQLAEKLMFCIRARL